MLTPRRRLLRSILPAGLALALALLLAACSTPGAVQPQPTVGQPTVGQPTPAKPIATPSEPMGTESLDDLIAALKAAGATVKETGETLDDTFFGVPGQIIEVNGAQVQVYAFDDAAAREAASAQITPEGQPNPTTMVGWIDQPNFWAEGRLIVLYLGTDAGQIKLFTSLFGPAITRAAAAPTQGAGAGEGDAQLPAAQAAIAALATRLNVSAGSITLVSAEATEWPDACLGLASSSEMCAQVITPGYRVVLLADGAQYVYHTNTDGSVLREE